MTITLESLPSASADLAPVVSPLSAEVCQDAINYLDAELPVLAAHMLRCEFDKDTSRWEIARLANMIHPCGMLMEARRELVRLKAEAV